jgi:hypothetical protein
VKIEHWVTALHARAQELLGTPFKYGVTDCPMVCLMMHDAMSSKAEADVHRGNWSDRKTGLDYVLRTGNSLENVLRGLGCTDVAVGFQQVGDFILTITADGWVRGHVCLGEKVISADRDNGVSLYGTVEILKLPDHTHKIFRLPAWSPQ